MAPSRSGDVGLFRSLARQARSSAPHLIVLFLVGLLASPLALLAPLPLKIAVDSVLGGRPLPGFLDAVVPATVARSAGALLVVVAALTVLIALLSLLQSFAQQYLSSRTGEKLVLDFRARIFGHLQRLSLSYHDSTGTADSVYRIQNDAPAIRYIVVDGFIPFVSAGVTLAGMIYVTFRIDWQMALLALAVAPPLLWASRSYRPRLRRQSREVKRLESAAQSVIHEVLGALRVVKSFGQEGREGERFVRRADEGMRGRIRLTIAEGHFNVIVGLLIAAGMAAVLFVGVGHVQSGLLTLGDLLLVIGYVAKLYDPMKTMSRKLATVQGHLASLERAFSLLDRLPDVTERPNAGAVTRARGAVAFRHVSFSYAPDRPVLHDVSFEIGPGTRLGIGGTTGAGKSTLISLLTRLYDPTEGQVVLDGVDLRDYRLEDLRRQFAVVLQDPVLFSTSIAENIAYAVPGASREQILAAAQAANADEFIERLPRQYDTQVGERGVMLSGGQRQRIALARAFLKDSPVLILDEPTSSVDAETEAAIVEALERLKQGRTVIIISHRPSTLAGCSALLTIERGRVVADTLRRLAQPSPTADHGPPPVASAGRHKRLLGHPAVQAWRRLGPELPVPDRIAALKTATNNGQRTSVYRLEGADPDGTAVIAKRCKSVDARIERSVYEQFLPRLPLNAPRYHGCVKDPGSAFTWFFIGEVRGEEYSYLLPQHRVLAARWLAVLHTGASPLGRPQPLSRQRRLPDTGPTRYLEQLRTARDFIRAHVDNPMLTAADVAFLDLLLARLDDVEEHWGRLEEACSGMPQTLVHGDFSGKNLRVLASTPDPLLVVFDWEDAGWGVPAADLAQLVLPSSRLSANPDLATYWSVVRDHWRDYELTDFERIATCGTVFRALAALQWESHTLAHESVQWAVSNMRLYDAELAHALDRLGGSATGRSRRASAAKAGRRRRLSEAK